MDRTLDHRAHFVGAAEGFPRIGVGLLDRQRDPLTIAIDFEHFHLHLIADLDGPRTGD